MFRAQSYLNPFPYLFVRQGLRFHWSLTKQRYVVLYFVRCVMFIPSTNLQNTLAIPTLIVFNSGIWPTISLCTRWQPTKQLQTIFFIVYLLPLLRGLRRISFWIQGILFIKKKWWLSIFFFFFSSELLTVTIHQQSLFPNGIMY